MEMEGAQSGHEDDHSHISMRPIINAAMKAQSKFPDSLLELRTASTTALCH